MSDVECGAIASEPSFCGLMRDNDLGENFHYPTVLQYVLAFVAKHVQ
jgi:hypothetical protein